ncbi:hypothetical protein DVH26_35415 [Paenibacillus sp. H1-7]|uniref:hypothetical protein n=1 Tax=Paenibacillus sp. H1-7 TaxID=2282849 RepID=UPI001EF86A6A|nr:hypothetical protein [Paenibacillus sp. H1-7]ULL19247.1 hypothetical protein DVH26_35415 [Paenibacillus sp. H1-7]
MNIIAATVLAGSLLTGIGSAGAGADQAHPVELKTLTPSAQAIQVDASQTAPVQLIPLTEAGGDSVSTQAVKMWIKALPATSTAAAQLEQADGEVILVKPMEIKEGKLDDAAAVPVQLHNLQTVEAAKLVPAQK